MTTIHVHTTNRDPSVEVQRYRESDGRGVPRDVLVIETQHTHILLFLPLDGAETLARRITEALPADPGK